MTVDKELLRQFSSVTGGLLVDPETGEWNVSRVFTQETLSNWFDAAKLWYEAKGYYKGEIAGLTFMSWSECVAAKGLIGTSVSVVDFKSVRVVLPNIDLHQMISANESK